MTRRIVGAIAFGLVVLVAAGTWAQTTKTEKLVFKGPTKQTLGQFDVIVPEGSAAEAQYQPDQNRLAIKTTVGEARIVTSARFLLLIENEEGTVEVTLPTGRRISIEPGKSDIVGRALTDDPGTISVRVASSVVVTVLDTPAAALSGQVTQQTQVNPVTNPRPEGIPVAISPSTVSGQQRFGSTTP